MLRSRSFWCGAPLVWALLASVGSLFACGEGASDADEGELSSSSETGETGTSEPAWAFELGDGFVDLLRLEDGDLLAQFATDSECCEGTIAYFALARLSPEGETRWVRDSISIANEALMPQGICALGEGAVYLGVGRDPQGDELVPELGFIGPEGELTSQILGVPTTVSMPASPEYLHMACAADGGYWVVSTFGASTEAAPFLLRYDAEHNLQWSLDYAATDAEPDPPSSIDIPVALESGGFALVERRAGTPFSTFALSVHAPDGALLWTQAVSEANDTWATSVRANDQHILVQSSGDSGSTIFVFNLEGELVTSQAYPAGLALPALARGPMSDGELLGLVASSSAEGTAGVYELGSATQLRAEPLLVAELAMDLGLPWLSLGPRRVSSGGTVRDAEQSRVGVLRLDEF